MTRIYLFRNVIMTRIELKEDINDQNLALQNVNMTKIWTGKEVNMIEECICVWSAAVVSQY